MDLSKVWDTLEKVKDPEIPAVSVVEMGMIRAVGFQGSRLVVSLAPTFAGCPALQVIKSDIEAQLKAAGASEVDVRLIFRPPWTSNWITSAGREKLRVFGLAPPPRHTGDIEQAAQQPSTCPYCGSEDTEMKNSFGPTLCRAIYVCNNCRQPFEQFKPL